MKNHTRFSRCSDEIVVNIVNAFCVQACPTAKNDKEQFAKRCETGTQTLAHKPKTVSTGVNCVRVNFKDSSCQTQIASTCSVGTQTNRPVLTIEDIEDDKQLRFYTGIPNKSAFYALFDELSCDEERLAKVVGSRACVCYVLPISQVLDSWRRDIAG
jgi:hypothetical protein